MREKGLFHFILRELSDRFGEFDILSPWFSFDFTTYYEPEMGTPLFRRMAAFKTLIAQKDLPWIKTVTNDIERQYAANSKRRVNIDPGYVTQERFVLATGKNYTHRIYLDRGIYADLTLIFQKGTFVELPWTYPDYRSKTIKHFIQLVRNRYVVDLKNCGPPPPRIAEERSGPLNDQKHDRLRPIGKGSE